MAAAVQAAYRRVLGEVAAAAARAGRATAPRLVAVSKTKPVEAVLAAHACGCVHFGENYVQEIIEKAPLVPPEVAWHFIGHLQSNKAKALVAGVPNLWVVESVDSGKLADLLNRAVATTGGSRGRLRVFIQVNTSGEEQKGGVQPGEAVALARHISASCPHLHMAGLMTIGKLGDVSDKYFVALRKERDEVAVALGVDPESLELSMGMSGDYEMAIQCGSTNVRVGSSIFGEREYKASKPKPQIAAAAGTASAAAAEGAS